MVDAGKILFVVGAAVMVIGAAVWAMGRAGFRGLPGDLSYHGEHVRFYFPLVSCIVLSVVLTVALWIWRWLSGR